MTRSGSSFRLLVCLPLLHLVATVAVANDTAPFWLVDLEARGRWALTIDGTNKPVLNPFRREHSFLLSDLPPNGDLTFVMGIKKSGRVRFEVIVERNATQAEVVYERELSDPSWVEGGLSLPLTEYPEGRLIFRKSLVEGSLITLLRSAWGDPAIVPPDPVQHPSVVLVSIDTLRADRLGCYGYTDGRTPAFDRLAAAGTIYAQAYSPSTWTYPSHASLLFGLYPSVLPGPHAQSSAVDSREPLPQILRKAGYSTAGFTGGGFLSQQWGFPVGFGTYFMFPQPQTTPGICRPERFDGPEVFRRGIAWLRNHADSPFFLFLHTYDVHDRCPVRPASLARFEPWADPGPTGRERLWQYYDELVTRTDQRLAALYDEIERLGIADSTLVAVISDHGEAFWEHGFFGHGCRWKPYEELVRVPLILRSPGTEPGGKRIDEPVSIIDLAPTILSLTGLPVPASMQGRLLPGLGLPSVQAAKPIYVQCEDTLAVRSGSHKLITSREGEFPDEIYDLADDPAERRNLLGENATTDAELRSYAADYWKTVVSTEHDKIDVDELDEKTRQRLHALGYLD